MTFYDFLYKQSWEDFIETIETIEALKGILNKIWYVTLSMTDFYDFL